MATQRTKKTRRDGVTQHYNVTIPDAPTAPQRAPTLAERVRTVGQSPTGMSPEEYREHKSRRLSVRVGDALGRVADAARPVQRIASGRSTPAWLLEVLNRTSRSMKVRAQVWANPNFDVAPRVGDGPFRDYLLEGLAKNPSLSGDDLMKVAEAHQYEWTSGSPRYRKAFEALREHPNATPQVRAFIDELPGRFGS